jgi:hypothetical protein
VNPLESEARTRLTLAGLLNGNSGTVRASIGANQGKT